MHNTSDILVMGKDAVSVSNITDLLETYGYHPVFAADGKSAAELCRATPFNLALVDTSCGHFLPDITATSPDTACILLTDTPVQATIDHANIIAVMPRTFDAEILLGIVSRKIEPNTITRTTKKTELNLVDSRELEKMKSSLLSTVSHELRTPLASIKGYASMILDYEDRMKPEARRESLNAIVKACDHLVELIDQLIDLSRFKAGLIKLGRVPSSLRHIINTAIEETSGKNPDYRFKKTVKGLPSQMDLDVRRVRQIFDVLLDNAIKYSPPGTLISIGAESEKDKVLVWVRDEGYGIPADERERIFNSLYQIKDFGKVHPGGLGLGLSLCKNLVESHGGRIWVESNPDKGSTFFFTLPLK